MLKSNKLRLLVLLISNFFGVAVKNLMYVKYSLACLVTNKLSAPPTLQTALSLKSAVNVWRTAL